MSEDLSPFHPDSPEFHEAMLEGMRMAFAQTPLHALLNITLADAGPGHAEARMPVTPAAFNSTGNLHGGAIATLIDVACGAAAATSGRFLPGTNHLVTADLHIRYLGRPHGDAVAATATMLKAGRQLIVVECKVTDVEQRIIAVADFAGMVVPLREPLHIATTSETGHPDI